MNVDHNSISLGRGLLPSLLALLSSNRNCDVFSPFLSISSNFVFFLPFFWKQTVKKDIHECGSLAIAFSGEPLVMI